MMRAARGGSTRAIGSDSDYKINEWLLPKFLMGGLCLLYARCFTLEMETANARHTNIFPKK
jgi:hypothetical protein